MDEHAAGVPGWKGSCERREAVELDAALARRGVYELYARMFVVANDPFNNDSFYYANGFGTKAPASDLDWILSNGLASPVGYTLATDKVVGGGPRNVGRLEVGQALGVRRWRATRRGVRRSPTVSLTHTFQIAGREDGLWIRQVRVWPPRHLLYCLPAR